MSYLIEQAISAFKQGEIIIVSDDENRENEGDLVCAGALVDAQKINFMASYGKGLICCPINEKKAVKLNLHPMVNDNTCPYQTAFTVSIDAKIGTTTGISAFDRALTIKKLSEDDVREDDFVRPGHMFPLIANNNGVTERRGQTEAAIDLCKLTNLPEVGVICEIMDEDGTMAKGENLINFAKKHNLHMITIEQLSKYIGEKNDI